LYHKSKQFITKQAIFMKKTLLFSLLVILCLGMTNIQAQTQVPNGGFENWTDENTCDGWQGKVSLLGIMNANLLTQSTVSRTGQFAARVETKEMMLLGTIPGIATCGKMSFGLSGLALEGGVPINGKPAKLKGYYQYDNMVGDTMLILVIMTKWNNTTGTRDTLSQRAFVSNQMTSVWAPFSINISYAPSTAVPDSFNIIMLSSAGYTPQVGSYILVDDLEFEYNNQNIAENDFSIFNLYPNPSNGIVNISINTNQTAEILVYNSLGQLVHQENNVRQWTILDLTEQNKGLYFVKVNIDNNSYTQKVLIK
jgi:hypothetical protein